jgi:hypothetical protein
MVLKYTACGTAYIGLPYTDEERKRLERDWFGRAPRAILRAPRKPKTERQEPPSTPSSAADPDLGPQGEG